MFRYRDYELAVRSRLDTASEEVGDSNGYYSTEEDFLPSFNLACQHVAKTLAYLLEQSKMPSESLSELRYQRTFVSSPYSEVVMGSVLFIEAVYPLPEVKGLPLVEANKPTEVTSSVTVIDTKYSASLLSAERASMVHHNPFIAGYDKQGCVKTKSEQGRFLTFSYTSPYRAKDGSLQIKIMPSLKGGLCTVLCINNIPTYSIGLIVLNDYNTEIPLPISILPFIVEKALFFLAYKQGDGPTVGELSEAEADRILSILL